MDSDEKINESQIREAFSRVRQDISILNQELNQLKQELAQSNENLHKISEILENIQQNQQKITQNSQTHNPTQEAKNSTIPTHNPTLQQSFKPLKTHFLPLSTGNRGVPTDRQTNQHTDTLDTSSLENYQNSGFSGFFTKKPTDSIENAARILDSLDSIKKEIRLKFKGLTDQEILVFSTLYQLEDQEGVGDYKALATRLNLTESSIRDYIGRLIKKGIPVEKTRLNNKQIQLKISQNLRKIASLSTILQLRDI